MRLLLKKLYVYLKFIITFVFLIFLYFQWTDVKPLFLAPPININFSFIFAAFILIPFNIGIETYKLYISFAIPPNFVLLYRTVLYGSALGLLTPNRLGEYFARVERLGFDVVGASWYGRTTQMFVTLLLGSVAVYLLPLEVFPIIYIYSILIFFSIYYLFLILFPSIIWKFFQHKFIQRYLKNIPTITLPLQSVRIKIVWASFLRFILFSVQYLLLLKGYGIIAPDNLLSGYILWVFLVKSFFSFLTIADLGPRETAAVFLAKLQGWNLQAALAASITLFLFNQILPALAGIVVAWQTNKQENFKTK